MQRRRILQFGTGAAVGGALAACGGGNGSNGGNGGNSPGGAPAPATPPAPPSPTPAPAAPATAISAWNNVALAAVRATHAVPPVAARSLAIVHTAMYDAWAAYDVVAVGTRYGARLRQPAALHTAANKARAFSYAAYIALVDQFPAQKAAFDAHMAALGYPVADAVPGDTGPAGIGVKAASLLLAYRRDDGANQYGDLGSGGLPYADYAASAAYLPYAPRNAALAAFEPTLRSAAGNPGLWSPLAYRDGAGILRTQSFTTPYWGLVRPFALASGRQFRPGPPAPLGSPEFAAQARLIVDIQRALTERQMVVADFWAGGAGGELPTSYWCQFAQAVALRDQLDLDAGIKLFFALANANFDAGIAAWDAKRHYDSPRPISAVRYLYSGQTLSSFGLDGPAGGLRLVSGEAWMPFHLATNPTPPHPDHVSGHSTYSAASAEVLKLFTGSDRFGHTVTVAPHSLLFNPALPQDAVSMRWESFSAAALDAGNSRILAGIHFPRANDDGRTLGIRVGAAVFARAQDYWQGRCNCL